ncbi:hypothetical protein BDR06DRAFT_1025523 [Suillus hirtellus]|nr:hypothetical protein BDR06DRAFT_1025523 [Suillus hirtellus]
MQSLRDQVIRDVEIFVHHTGGTLDLSGMAYAEGAGWILANNAYQGHVRKSCRRSRTGSTTPEMTFSACSGYLAIARIKNSKFANAPLDYHLTKSNTKSSSNSWCP